jgi:hypothetical protein
MFHTGAAPDTPSGFKRHAGRFRHFHFKDMERTGFHTLKAKNTPGRIKKKLCFRYPRFRVMTPAATQGTAFKEDDRSDTITVIHTAPFNIKYQRVDINFLKETPVTSMLISAHFLYGCNHHLKMHRQISKLVNIIDIAKKVYFLIQKGIQNIR